MVPTPGPASSRRPHGRIEQFFSMQATMPKRKADKIEQSDPYHSDGIQVASQTSPRQALRNVPIQEAQNKRRRVVDCVLIPVSQETRKRVQDAESCPQNARAHHLTLSRTPGDDDELQLQHAGVRSANPEAMQQQQTKKASASSIRKQDIPSADHFAERSPDDNMAGMRPRRSAPRKSYAAELEVSDDSADELTFAGRALMKTSKKPRKKAVSMSSEDDEDFAAAEETEDDFPDADSDSDGANSSIGNESESGSESDIAQSRTRTKSQLQHSTEALPETRPTTSQKISKEMKNLISTAKGLDLSLPPLHDIGEIFADLTSRTLSLGLDKVVHSLQHRRLRVATMCSGTESPLLAVESIQDALKSSLGFTFNIEHLFSAEIVEFKQAYIERNFNPSVIFRDIRELVHEAPKDFPMATTAYGGKAPVPKEVDIVIAGTSCVDHSSMNNKPKEFGEVGESGDTWSAVLAYCKAFRPPIVILENVKTAPWDYLLQDYKDAGYEPAGAYVDTKDFYLPQTRQRGYMVCFDKTRLQKAGIKTAGNEWKTLMEKCKRRASSPVSSFLLPDHQIPTRPLQVNEQPKTKDWAKCEIRQMRFRLEKGLGVNRPITHWSESGSMFPPDHGSQTWHSGQVERVLDTLDAATLRKANEGYDARFKTRVWDVSQNIERISDTHSFGLLGCITPTGINFVSDSWRALAAEECLMLQGIPLNNISFTVETHSEVQDLAGNAMSGPLVGSAILSALIAGYKMFDSVPDSDIHGKQQATPRLAELIAPDALSIPAKASEEQVDIGCLHQGLEKAARRCYCEGGHGLTSQTIQRCADCGHTTCIACGGNPEHNYKPSQQLTLARTPFAAFEEDVRSSLPLQLKLANAPDWPARKSPMHYYENVRPLTSAIFSLSSVVRSHCIRVTYTAPEGRLELCLTEGRAIWYLFANAPLGLAANASLRESLSQPVAKTQLHQSTLGGTWEWRAPTESTANATISGRGEQLPAWQARMQIPKFRQHSQCQFLDIEAEACWEDINGTYQLLPKCGTANESMYKRIQPEEDSPVYLFLDPARIGPADSDCFVFARNHSRLDYDETRQIIARIDPSWRPWDQHVDAGTRAQTKIKHYEWLPASGSSLAAMNTDLTLHRPKTFALPSGNMTCNQALLAVSADVNLTSVAESHRTQNRIVSVDDEGFFSETAWIFEAMRRQLPTDDWIEMQVPSQTECLDCAPAKPALRWMAIKGKEIAAYEDHSSATVYERAIKRRQAAIVVQFTKSNLSLAINLVSLAHRARSRLPATSGRVNYQWRLTTSRSTTASAKHFRLSPTQGVHPSEEHVHMSAKLFPKQRLALSWMRAQEAGLGKPMMLEEAEEASLPHLGWRVEMRAQTVQYVKGGVCADHPGFGKTITGLALIHSEWLKHGSKALHNALRASEKVLGSFKTSAATVIVCPEILVEQWYNEAREQWASEDGIYTVTDASDLAEYTIEQFESAKLIIMSKAALASAAYAERLATFAAVPGPHKPMGRAHAAWLTYAVAQVPKHLEILQSSGWDALGRQLKAKFQENLNSKEFEAYVPSKRMKGRAYVEAQSRSRTEFKIKPKVSKASGLRTTLLGCPLFEMFLFNRVIADEFHDFTNAELEVLTALKADKRWGLSGTPKLSDCYDVAQIGKLLNVPLRVGSLQRGFMKLKNIKSLHIQMTKFEKFDAARTSPSVSQNGRIQELAQDFLDTFARRNLMDFDQLAIQQHLVPVNLGLGHHAMYHELSQHLNSMDMKIRKAPKKDRNDVQQQLGNAVDDAETAEEALSRAAAYPRRANSGGGNQATINDWIARREEEAKALTRELGLVLRQACTKEPEEYYGWREARIDANELKDKETAALVKHLCKQVDDGKTSASVPPSKAKSATKGGKRDATSLANKLATRLVSSKRSARYLLNVKKLQALALDSMGRPSKCDDPDCTSDLEVSDKVAVSGLCGHLVCEDCLERTRSRNMQVCAAEGCGESMASHHLLWNTKLGDIRNLKHSIRGAKIDAAMAILQDIRAKGEQAVLFVQYADQLREVERALRERKVPGLVIKTEGDLATKIVEFVEDASNTAIVLDASGGTAAGLNLQVANHVIFLAPLLRDTQYAYDSTMAQAVGRVRRHGQQKKIHVYRIFALNTIDVDILEHRERRTDALTEQGAPTVTPPPAPTMLDMHSAEPQPERTQLVRDEDGKFSLRPQSWLVRCGADEDTEGDGEEEAWRKVKGRRRVGGWEDFSSLVKFSRGFVEDDE